MSQHRINPLPTCYAIRHDACNLWRHVAKVLRQMIAPHHCHAVACETPVPPKMHMCLKHWCMVPKLVQDLIWHHYREGQEVDKKPSVEYIAMAFASVSCVAMKEGRTLPSLTGETHV